MAQITVLRHIDEPFQFLTVCWLCATRCEWRFLSFSGHINVFRRFGIVFTYSVPSWSRSALGGESVFLTPLDRVSTPQQETDSVVLCFCC